MAFHPVGATLWQQAQQASKNSPVKTPLATTDNQSASAIVNATLNAYGLGSLAQWAWQKHLAGDSDDYILQVELPQTQQYQQRFPGMKSLQDRGVNITPAQYISAEQTMLQSMQKYGVDTSTYGTVQELGNLIGNQVSPSELESRLATYQAAVRQAPQAARDYLAQNFGINEGDLINYWLDPKQSLPDMQMKAQAAQIGGAAATSGFGFLDAQQALNLAQVGVTASQAQAGFQKAATQLSLTQDLGDGTGAIDKNTLVGADLGNDGGAALQLQQEEAKRVARFQAGGTFAASPTGVSGLGVSNQGF